ncbi:MAG: A/G-specific adenine glycosylase [Burkholderiaceae bacterium]|nr:A/G-specific adenine glycosylase [Burkholderiaceae bacterium]
MTFTSFTEKVASWQRNHGRHDLPWQVDRTPYRVWVSEIMLQQTQVVTVLAYYGRFLQHFPDVFTLANAPVEAVLSLWAGLGYYSRARNLHRCARELVLRHGGRFPATATELAALPGIGKSTAAAISAFCNGERVAILDANVKRVLVRYHAVHGDIRSAATERQLWSLADRSVSSLADVQSLSPYTQGLMDLGAMVCTPRRPLCQQCPLAAECCALAQGIVDRLPVRAAARATRTARAMWLLQGVDADGRVFLIRRGDQQIWGGLYCLPDYCDRETAVAAGQALGWELQAELAPVSHTLTHLDLSIHRLVYRSDSKRGRKGGLHGYWVTREQLHTYGLPAPVKRMLQLPVAASRGGAQIVKNDSNK